METSIKDYESGGCRETVLLPLTDIYETETGYHLIYEVPGISKENFEITANGRELEIKGNLNDYSPEGKKLVYGEYEPASFYRKFKTDENVDTDKIEAKLENGLLTLILNKKEEALPKKIKIH